MEPSLLQTPSFLKPIDDQEPASSRAPVGAIVVAVLASAALLPAWAAAWETWLTDPLRSLGLVFPPLALVGTVMAWRRLGWRQEGRWWGGLLIAVAMLGARVCAENMLVMYFGATPLRPLHPGMALFVYGVGVVVLLGGTTLLRQAIAPLSLLLLVDPVPHSFNRYLDLPLQHLSADTARAFAHAIGLQPTGEQLQMMFAPRFGMMIVPGCDGIRGSVTLGYLALIYGYVRRLSARTLAVFTIAAVFTGYLLNLARLCVLVLYYRAGLAFPSIRGIGTQIDYVIGCTVFLVATLAVGMGIAWYRMKRPEDVRAEPLVPPATRTNPPGYAKAAAVGLMVVAVVVTAAQVRSAAMPADAVLTVARARQALPVTAGPYGLVRTWTEVGSDRENFVFGEYVREGSGERLQLGVYLLSDEHLVSLSKYAQGVLPVATGTLDVSEPGRPARLATNVYVAGTTETFDAESFCSVSGCESPTLLQADGVRVGAPSHRILFAKASRHVPIVVRQEWTTGTASLPVLQAHFAGQVADFLHGADLRGLF